jgi:hypothetical protein
LSSKEAQSNSIASSFSSVERLSVLNWSSMRPLPASWVKLGPICTTGEAWLGDPYSAAPPPLPGHQTLYEPGPPPVGWRSERKRGDRNRSGLANGLGRGPETTVCQLPRPASKVLLQALAAAQLPPLVEHLVERPVSRIATPGADCRSLRQRHGHVRVFRVHVHPLKLVAHD